MKKEIGLWIDHREAVIVTIAGEGEKIQRLSSDLEKYSRPEAGSTEISPEHLHRYYAEVITAIQAADTILIIGPGEAKGELEKQLANEKLSERTVNTEAADKLTEPQIVAKIRQHFQK